MKESGIRDESIAKSFIEIGLSFLAAFIIYQVLIFATGTQVPVVSIASGSMIPKFYPGDLVFAVAPENLEAGDIVIYHAQCPYMPDRDIIHRILGFKDGKIITKGDNNPYPDPCAVSYSQLKGKVLFQAPLLGWPRLILSYATGF